MPLARFIALLIFSFCTAEEVCTKESCEIFKLPKLPFEENALEPYISHGYVTALNKLTKDTKYKIDDLETLLSIIKNEKGKLFNVAAQHWNHEFYWNCLSPNSQQPESLGLKSVLEKHFGTIEKFQEHFTQAALDHFGSGWIWVVFNPTEEKFKILSTSDAKNPITQNLIPVFVIDVWEHAYYIDTKNRRNDYIKNIWNIVNWKFFDENIEAALTEKENLIN